MSIVISELVFIFSYLSSVVFDSLFCSSPWSIGTGIHFGLALINATIAGGIYQLIVELRKIQTIINERKQHIDEKDIKSTKI